MNSNADLERIEKRLQAANPVPDVALLDVSPLVNARTAARSERSRRRFGRRTRRGALIALGVLVVGVPAAAAVRSALDSSEIAFTVPPPPASSPDFVNVNDSPGWVIDEGRAGGLYWTVAAAKCTVAEKSGLRVLALIGDTPRSGGMSISGCATGDGVAAVPPPATSRSRGVTLLYGVVPEAARTVDFDLREYEPSREPGAAPTRSVKVPAERFPASALAAGRLPDGYRIFKTQVGPDDIQIVSAIVRDAAGAAILDCTAAACRRP